MLLIADSGSTKCDWKLLDNQNQATYFSSIGINPYFHNEKFIEDNLKKQTQLMEIADQVDYLFFYCAGGSTKELKAIVHRGLSLIFRHAKIVVDHDLVGAALSTYDGSPGITCILGTGSNSVYFDGDIMREEVPALAYILGDEGSGSYYGKKLLAAFLYKQLPQEMHDALIEEYKLDKDTVIDSVYMKPHANVYLASFMRFMSRFKETDWVKNNILHGMEHFLTTHVLCYSNAKKVPVHFVGSIAYYFRDELFQVADKLGLKVGKIDKKPIDGLVEYHINFTLPKLGIAIQDVK
ncbi:MAG: BadF/BadG/BcrA/BcrD ATPase family protein [Luteibaculaceae bacterium]